MRHSALYVILHVIWELSTMLNQLLSTLFEPAHNADMKYLPWKMTTLLALQQARRVGKLEAFPIKEPFLHFAKDEINLCTNP